MMAMSRRRFASNSAASVRGLPLFVEFCAVTVSQERGFKEGQKNVK